ncbi:MAG: PAS domain S-box protein [Promethearchaeota archaeon]
MEEILTLSSDLIFKIDQNLQILYVNEIFLKETKFRLDELIQTPIHSVIFPGDHKLFDQLITQIKLDSKVSSTKMRFQKKNGDLIQVNLNLSGEINIKNQFIAFLGVAKDITPLYDAEMKIIKDQSFLKNLIDHNPYGIAMYNAQGQFLSGNQSLLKILDIFPSKKYRLFEDPFFNDPNVETNFNRIKSGEILRFDKVKSDGKFLSITLFPIFQEGIKIKVLQNIIGMYSDKTTQVKAEEEIVRRKIELETILENANEGFLMLNSDRILTKVNTEFCLMVKREKKDLIGHKLEEILSEESKNEFNLQIQEWKRVNSFLWTAEVKLPDRDVITCLIRGKVLYNEKKEMIGGFAMVSNLTDQIQAVEEIRKKELQLQQIQKVEAIGRLAGGIAHDFNNILTVINGYSDLILESIDKEFEFREELEEISEAGKRAKHLTSQLLNYSRKGNVVLQNLDLNYIIINLQKMLQRLIGENFKLKTILSQPLGSILGDSHQMEQVIMNLCVNARDAMPYGGELIIETDNFTLTPQFKLSHSFIPNNCPIGEYILLKISDTGSGMSEETIAHIFEPFFTTKEEGKGTGLGLSVVFGIIQNIHGFINVQSELGKGTTFNIYIPQKSQEKFEISKETPLSESLSGSGHILVAEDEAPVRNIIKKVLQQHGYFITTVNDGKEALDFLKNPKNKIDLLVSDVVMPKIGGKELISLVRKTLPNLKILLISGYLDFHGIEKEIVDKKIEFMQKPFDLREFLIKIKQLLYNKS